MESDKGVFRKSGLIIILITIVFALMSAVFQITLPHVQPADSSASEFSAERAYKHLEIIAKDTHYTGTSMNEDVREYIIKSLGDFGLEASVQEKIFFEVNRWGTLNVNNIICRIKGTNGEGSSVMLVAHYDTMITGPGAMDDGSGVVTLLETARAITAGQPLKNDILLLFTDGEEPGLLGAQAFVEDNKALLGKIAVIANFDAGGTTGPAALTETSSGNEHITGYLFKETSESAAFSSLVELSKFFPSGTDMRVLEKTGVSYLNFLVSMHKERIHTEKDNIRDFSIGTLQQQGNYALAFCRVFGNMNDLGTAIKAKSDNIFFPIFKGVQVIYGERWIIPLALFGILAYAAILIIGFKAKKLTISGMCRGLAIFPSGVLISGVFTFIIVNLARLLFKSRIDLDYMFEKFVRGSEYTNICYVGFAIFTFAIMSYLFFRALNKKSFTDLFSGVLLMWCIPVLLTCFFIKGLSYIFVWPFIFALAVQGCLICLKNIKSGIIQNLLMTASIIVPGVILYFPVAYISSSVGVDNAPLIMMFISLPSGIVAPYVIFRLQERGRLVYSLTGMAGIAFILAGIIGFAIS